MSGLFAELKRRNVIRMAGLYLVAAWLIVQVSSTVLPMFEAPAWLPRTVVIVLALGFIPALIFSWVFEVTPEGLKRDAEVPPDQSIAPRTARRMDRTIIVVLVLALGYFAVDKFVLAPREKGTGTSGGSATASVPVSKSIAVLPFTDLSPAHDQEYFSDGMAEELLNALVRVKDLKVAGRTSSFYYKGRNEDLRAIGKALGVANVLEGSVRKQGDKVRITAQLVRSDDGFHLWSDTFDGDLKDVFELQERIARAITGKLEVVLAGGQDTRLVQAGTSNSEAYALYLQATAIFNKRDYPHMADAIAWLEEALKLDPGYARGHARLALIHVLGREEYGSVPAEGERHAREAMALDPKLAEPHVVLGVLAREQRRFLEAQVENDQAMALEPDDASTNLYAAEALIMCGYTRQGIAALDRTLALDPILPNALNWRGLQYTYAGDLAAGERSVQRAGELGLTYLTAGNYQEIARRRREFAKATEAATPGAVRSLQVCSKEPDAAAATLLKGVMGGDAAARAGALAVIDACLAAKPATVPATLPRSLMRLDQPARALAVLLEHPTSDDAFVLQMLWNSDGRAAREDAAFPDFARRFGYAELWDRYGAPDLCERRAPGEYVCH